MVTIVFALALGAIAVVSARQAGTPPSAGQAKTPSATYRVDINYVEIPAVVVDSKDRFVETLQQGDFEIYEDGRRQTLSAFSVVNAPVERADAPLVTNRVVEADVQTNAMPFQGRLFVILLDDLHIDAADTMPTRRAARSFIERQIGADDLGAVVCASGRSDVAQDFTANKSLLAAAVDRFTGRRLQSAAMNRFENPANQGARAAGASRSGGQVSADDLEAGERSYNARLTLSAIRRLSDGLSAIKGRRKALVLLSGGIDASIANITVAESSLERGSEPTLTTNLLPGAAAELQSDAADAMSAATRANVSIYAVDPRGLVGPGGADFRVYTEKLDPNLRMGTQALEDEIRQGHDSLRQLADSTGGFATVNTNNLGGAFDRIRQDNSRYYLLGYYPANDKRDGKFRRIDVKVTKPGLTVRARRGYLAARIANRAPKTTSPSVETAAPTVPAAVEEAINAPLAVPGLRLTAFAAPFRRSGGDSSVTLVLQVDGRDLRFKEANGRFDGALALSVIAVAPDGKVKASLGRTIAMPLKPESYKQVSANGIRIVEQLDLPHGRYQLRIGAQDVDSQLVGSVHYELDVPDFHAAPIAMSGLVLTSSLAGMVPLAPGSQLEQLRKQLPGPPTVSRRFRAGELLAVMAEVYDRDASLHTIDIVTTVTATDGRQMFRHDEARSSAERDANQGAYAYAARIPLAQLPPGLYVLKVEARSRLDAKLSVAREIQFEIVP